jgi:Orotate phosphoribosyltransferase
MKDREEVAEILINIQSIKFSFDNPFILTSGLKSPVYVDCRKNYFISRREKNYLN